MRHVQRVLTDCGNLGEGIETPTPAGISQKDPAGHLGRSVGQLSRGHGYWPAKNPLNVHQPKNTPPLFFYAIPPKIPLTPSQSTHVLISDILS